jgi:hypothetical protein
MPGHLTVKKSRDNVIIVVKVKTRKRINSVNTLEEYKEIEIVSPQEL